MQQAAHCTANEAKEVPSLFVGRLPAFPRMAHGASSIKRRRLSVGVKLRPLDDRLGEIWTYFVYVWLP